MDTLVATPCHSLIHQSLHASECKTETNGDGFGLGWYGEREVPGLYRELRPAWSDENLLSIASQVRSRLFFAHVRAATGTATTRANCHPYTHGRWLFMHNGQIGGWSTIRRRVEALIPDELYTARGGTSDSEALFLAALAAGMEEDPVSAVMRTLQRVRGLMDEAGIGAPLRFTAALSDGRSLWAFRWACDAQPPSLYFRHTPSGLVLVSEPIDEDRANWQEVPRGHALVLHPDAAPAIQALEPAMARAA